MHLHGRICRIKHKTCDILEIYVFFFSEKLSPLILCSNFVLGAKLEFSAQII